MENKLNVAKLSTRKDLKFMTIYWSKFAILNSSVTSRKYNCCPYYKKVKISSLNFGHRIYSIEPAKFVRKGVVADLSLQMYIFYFKQLKTILDLYI